MQKFGLGMGIPLYVHPAIDPVAWASLAKPGLPVDWVVINQSNGPGDPEDAAIGDAARAVKATGADILGYIDADYGDRTDFAVFQDATTWAGRGYTGAFVDRVPTAVDKVAVMAGKINGLRAKGLSHIVLNMGTIPVTEQYARIADQLVVFEGHADDYEDAVFPFWMNNYSPSTFVHMVSSVSADQVADVVRLARQRPVGSLWMYESPNVGTSGNKWDGLPAYLYRLMSLMRQRA